MTDQGRIVSNDEATAISAVAKASDRALEIVQQVGGFFGKVLGTIPEDAVGFLGGDWLHHVRVRNLAKLDEETDRILENRGPKPVLEPVSLSLAIPLITAAQDESRKELQEIWARLLANAMDKNRGGVRLSFIETVKKFDPVDALVLLKLDEWRPVTDATERVNNFASALAVAPDEISTSLGRLIKLDCVYRNSMNNEYEKTAFGRLLTNACRQ